MSDQGQTIPTPARWIIATLSAALLLSGIGGVVGASVIPPRPAWAVIGFEAVIAFASVFGFFIAARRVREAPALAVLCIAGTTMVGAVLGYLAVKTSLQHLPLKAWLFARLGIAGLLGACCVVIALGASRPAWTAVARAAVFAVPLAGVAGWYRFANFAPLNSPNPALGDALRVSAIALVAAVCGVCVCATLHLTIKAFMIADEGTREG